MHDAPSHSPSLAGALLLFMAIAQAAMSQQPLDPGARAGAAMAMDSRTGALILFGGFAHREGEEVQLSDTWHWRNGCWRQVKVEGPPARSWATLTFDPKSRAVVLFGGKVDNTEEGTFGDTWQLKRDRWTEAKGTRSPPARAHHAAAWDSAAERVVVFGGSRGFGVLGDVWSWSDGDWAPIKVAAGPEARALHAMYFDPTRSGVVVYGGSSNPWPPFNLSDRWLLKGHEFRMLSSGPARAYHLAAMLGGRTFLSMGWGFEANAVVASWVEEQGKWRRLDDHEAGPEARVGAAYAVDDAAGALYMFGGMDSEFEPLDGLWRFDGDSWSLMQGCHG